MTRVWRLAQSLFALWLIHAVRGLRRQGVRIMADQQTSADQAADDLETLRTAIDTETNRIADLFKQMHDQLPPDGGLDAKQTASLKGFLRDHEARLRGIGADAANPVPTGPPTPATPATPATPEAPPGPAAAIRAADAAADRRDAEADAKARQQAQQAQQAKDAAAKAAPPAKR